MKKIPNPERQLAYLAYVNRENEFQHHGYNEEIRQYLMMQSGDPGAVAESQRMMRQAEPAALSADSGIAGRVTQKVDTLIRVG